MALTAPTLAQIKFALRMDTDEYDDRLNEMGATALERANRQAPDAPPNVAREAMLRFIGYLNDGIDGDFYSVNAWRLSGAESMLKPWTVRRAGAITGDV